MRYLVQPNLISREREPGSKRDRYRVRDDARYEAVVRRNQMLGRWEESLRDGLEAVGEGTPAGARIAESLAFLRFLQAELPDLLERWRIRRAELRTSLATDRSG